MKIRGKMLLSHLFVSLLPIVLGLVLLTFFTLQAYRQQEQSKLYSKLQSIRSKVDAVIDRYRSIAVWYAKYTELKSKEGKPVFLFPEPPKLDYFRTGYIEFTISTSRINGRSLSPDTPSYPTEHTILRSMWSSLSTAQSAATNTLTMFTLLSNIPLIKYFTALIDKKSGKPKGMIVFTIPLDRGFLQNLMNDDSSLILFIESDNGVLFSQSSLEKQTNLQQQLSRMMPNTQLKVKVSRKGWYYTIKDTLQPIPNSSRLFIGILSSVEAGMGLVDMFIRVGYWIIIFSALIAALIAFVFSRHITMPILRMNEMVSDFQHSFQMIPLPNKINDELDLLQKKFSEMSKNMLTYREELENYNIKLSSEVTEKTAVLTDTIRRLILVNNFSSFVMRAESLDESKFMKQLIYELKTIFNVRYLGFFKVKGRGFIKTNHIYGDQEFLKISQQDKFYMIEERFVARIFNSPNPIKLSGIGLSLIGFPIYFIDQIEYAIFMISSTENRDFIFETMKIIQKLITMKIYSLRLNSEKIQSEKLASLGQFASGVVHDIKNPLTVIKSVVEMIGDEDFTQQEKAEYTKMLLQEIERLSNMLNDILDFARGSIVLHLEMTSINEIISNLIKLYQKEAQKKDVTIEFEPHSEVQLRVDKDRLQRSIGNILNNALQAVDRGGEITIRTEMKIYDVVIRIQDNGPGIPEEIRKTLFEPFVTHGKRGGTGLGLSIVKKIVEAHGGNITYKTETGKGTTFYISLPV